MHLTPICRPKTAGESGLKPNKNEYFRKVKTPEKAKKKPQNREIPRLSLWLRGPDLNRRPPGYEDAHPSVKTRLKPSKTYNFPHFLPTNCRRSLCLPPRKRLPLVQRSPKLPNVLGKSPAPKAPCGKTAIPNQQDKEERTTQAYPKLPKPR